MSWYVENAEDVVGRPTKERPKQRKGKPVGKYGQKSFDTWASLLSRKGESLQRALGVRIGRILGCGYYGCTAESSPKKVIKLSPLPEGDTWADDEELKFWTKMKAEQRRPQSPASEGVVKVDHVWVVTDEQTDQKYMVVLRDAVEPFTATVPHPDDPGYAMLVPTPATVDAGLGEIPEGAITPDELRWMAEDIVQAIGMDKLLDPVLVATNEYRLGDVHLGNIGWHGGRLVIYDADYKMDAPGPDKELRVNRERQTRRGEYEPTFNEWSRLIADKGDSLQRALGAKVGRIIGCGAFGCVTASEPGKVIKLSSFRAHGGGDEELSFWTKMKSEQKRPNSPASKGVVKIDKVALVTDDDTGEEYVAVLRDEVEPLFSDDGTPSDATTARMPPAAVKMLRDTWHWEGIPAAAGAREAVHEYGLDDVHAGNLGWSGDRLVVYDGHTRDEPEDEGVDLRLRVNDAYSPFREHLQGGLASGMSPEDFDPEQLARGVEVELEHTQDLGIATEIAMDHLVEDPLYYEKLNAMEMNTRRRVVAQKMPPKGQRELLVDRDGGEWVVIPDSPFLQSEGERYTRDWVEQRVGPLRPKFTENARAFYVFEMSGTKPLRQVNVKPLTLTKAKQLARIGAKNGKHDRAVTTDPRKDDFRIVGGYEAGHGK